MHELFLGVLTTEKGDAVIDLSPHSTLKEALDAWQKEGWEPIEVLTVRITQPDRDLAVDMLRTLASNHKSRDVLSVMLTTLHMTRIPVQPEPVAQA